MQVNCLTNDIYRKNIGAKSFKDNQIRCAKCGQLIKSNANQISSNEQFIDNWMDHKEAAKLLHVDEKYLRLKDQHGNYVHFRELARIRPLGRKIIFLRTQVSQLRKKLELEALAASEPLINKHDPGVTYQEIAPELLRLGGSRTLKALGL